MTTTDIPTEDLTGRTFGKWYVESYAGKSRKRGVCSTSVVDLWNCVCKCRRTRQTIQKTNIIRGHSTQCRECQHEKLRKPKRPHLACWTRHRTEMCAEWQDEAVFGVWYLGRKGRNLLRINEALPYGPDNCYWSDTYRKGDRFRKRLTALRVKLLGESTEQATAWIASVTHQRRYQWWHKCKDLDAIPNQTPRLCEHGLRKRYCRACRLSTNAWKKVAVRNRYRAAHGIPLDAPVGKQNHRVPVSDPCLIT